MKTFFVGIATILTTSACGDDPRGKTHTYVVTCNFPRETTVDTLVTKDVATLMKTSYHIGKSYYPIAFCTVRTTIDETR